MLSIGRSFYIYHVRDSDHFRSPCGVLLANGNSYGTDSDTGDQCQVLHMPQVNTVFSPVCPLLMMFNLEKKINLRNRNSLHQY